MQLEYRLSLKDYQEANQAHLKSQLWIFYLLFWLLIVLELLNIIIEFFVKGKVDIYNYIFSFVMTILINPYFNPLLHYLVNYLVARTWKGFASLHQQISAEVNEEIFKNKTATFESSMQWQLFIKAVETNNLFMLYQGKALFNMLPKRAFNSDEQVEEFRELLRTKIEKFSQA